MEAPSSTLALPTPPSSRSNSSSSSSPDLSQLSIDPERSSAETTIFTIYSMYGDEGAQASWSASAFEDKSSSQELDISLGDSFTYNAFFNPASTHTPSPDTTFVDLSTDGKPLSKHSNSREPARTSGMSNGSAHLSYARPGSSYATPPSNGRNTLELPKPPSRPSSSHKRPRSAIASSSTSTDPELFSQNIPYPSPPHSRPPSDIQRTESPVPEPTLILTPPVPSSSLAVPPQTPSSSPTKQRSKLSSPSSNTSLVPSEGEDLDAFRVRSTYAQLDATGVKGDGWEEGVERTRARLRASRVSELRAEEALGDPSEKSRELDAEEMNVLASLDRYGFFTVTNHDRLVQLPSTPLAKRLAPVSAGPRTAPTHAVSVKRLPIPSVAPKEEERISKWGRMLEVRSRDRGGNVESWGVKASKNHKLRRRVYKGIPDRWRSAVWEVLMNRFSKSGHETLVIQGDKYREELEKPSSYDVQIDLDVPRTISGHIMFRTRYGLGQRSLFHVLHSFSLHCETCGYVQGMGPIAATLLCYFEPERVYAALVRLHDAYSMHTIFSPGFPGLLEAIYVQERIMELMMPGVYAAFKKHSISTTSYATKWYITLFANSVPFQTQLRLWDAFLLDGQDVFVGVAIAIVWAYRDHITSSAANFETILSLLSSYFVPEDDNSLLSWIEHMLGDKKLRSRMNQWRTNWRQLVATGRDGDALL